MRPIRKTASKVAAFALLVSASCGLVLSPAQAFPDASSGKSCRKLEDMCLKHVRQRMETEGKFQSDGIERPHLTETACYDAFHVAEQSGVWPQNLPYNFAVQCANR